eukprot:1416049-Amphidinium_carterae.2
MRNLCVAMARQSGTSVVWAASQPASVRVAMGSVLAALLREDDHRAVPSLSATCHARGSPVRSALLSTCAHLVRCPSRRRHAMLSQNPEGNDWAEAQVDRSPQLKSALTTC